jgi:hypothetical protein
MNQTQLIKDAESLKLTVSTGQGRVRIEGRTGDIVKVFAAQGCDIERDGETSYKVTIGGAYVAAILHGAKGLPSPGCAGKVPQGWAYAYVAKVLIHA